MKPDEIATMLQESSMDTSAGSGEGWEDFVRIHRGVCNRIMLVHDTLTEYAHADPERQQEMQAELGKEV